MNPQKPPPKPAKPTKPTKPIKNATTPSNRNSRDFSKEAVELPNVVHNVSGSECKKVQNPVPAPVNNLNGAGSPSKSSNPFDTDSTVSHLEANIKNISRNRVENQHSANMVIDKSNYDKMSHNKIFDKVCISDTWVLIFVIGHIIQFSILLVVGYPVFTTFIFVILVLLAVSVPFCIIYGRYLVRSKRFMSERNIKITKPEDESILNLPINTIYLFCMAAVMEGISYAIFASFVAGNTSELDSNHFSYNKSTLLETFRFSSIVLFCMHRIVRPANRLDPVRTMLEVSP